MPRHFSSEERIDIENRLIAAAKELFLQYGLNKTTISDITEKAHVGKGTFYSVSYTHLTLPTKLEV